MADQDAVITPGRAACEAWWTTAGLAGHREYLGHDGEYRNSRASWDAAAQAVLDRAFPGLRLERDQARADRDDYAARLKATDQSWARLAAERDKLAGLLDHAREFLEDITENSTDNRAVRHAASVLKAIGSEGRQP